MNDEVEEIIGNERATNVAAPERIQPVDLQMETQRSCLDYAINAIVDRALPDVRDGFKLIHHCILYAMYDGGYRSTAFFPKFSRIVGDVMGICHPHNDSAIYDAPARLVQWRSLHYSLVANQGNFGTPDNLGLATPRYTKCKMAPLAMEMLRDIDEDSVDFQDNYDGRSQEPVILPSRFPNLLVNGPEGTAIDMAIHISPHNLREVTRGAQWYPEHPGALREELFDALVGRIPGSDFSTGATILGRWGIEDAYRTGRGSITQRVVVSVEEIQGRQCLVVTGLPCQVNPGNLADRIAQLVRGGQVIGIVGTRDETSGRTGQRLVIVLKRDAVAKVVLNSLYKRTQLQGNLPTNMLALVDGVPCILSLDGSTRHWVTHQIDVIVHRPRLRLRKTEERLHTLEGLLRATDASDAVIAPIRRSPATEEARTGLMGLLDVDEVQAETIFSLQLCRLAALEHLRIQRESEELRVRAKDLCEIIASPEHQRGIVSDELAEIVEKYGNECRTWVVSFDSEISMEDLIPEEDAVVIITRSGYTKRTCIGSYRSQHRDSKDIRGAALREGGVVDHFLITITHRRLSFSTNYGRAYHAKGYELSEGKRGSRGQYIADPLAFQPGKGTAQVIELQNYNQADYLVLATRRGLVEKTRLSEYNFNRSGGAIAINLRQDEKDNYDELVSARLLSARQGLLLVSRVGQSLRLHAGDDTLRPAGRTTSDVTGIRFCGDDYLLTTDVVDPSWQDVGLFVVTEGGYAEHINVVDYPVRGRGGPGVKIANLVEARGNLMGALVTDSGDEVPCIIASGKVVRSVVVEVSWTDRTTQGVTFVKPDAGDRIIAVTRNTGRDMEEVVDAAGSAPSVDSADPIDQARALQAPEGDTGDSPADSTTDMVTLEDNESEVEA